MHVNQALQPITPKQPPNWRKKNYFRRLISHMTNRECRKKIQKEKIIETIKRNFFFTFFAYVHRTKHTKISDLTIRKKRSLSVR
jgi:hypothetical protein